MTEMIERVARATFAAWRKQMDDEGEYLQEPRTFDDIDGRGRDFAFMHARAAIEAMREPTETMKAAGAKQVGYDAYEPGEDVEMAVDCHHAMIDAALR